MMYPSRLQMHYRHGSYRSAGGVIVGVDYDRHQSGKRHIGTGGFIRPR